MKEENGIKVLTSLAISLFSITSVLILEYPKQQKMHLNTSQPFLRLYLSDWKILSKKREKIVTILWFTSKYISSLREVN